MYPHVIRLRGPWELSPLDAPAGAARPLRLPAAAGLGAPAWLVRRFGYPGRLDADERVFLTIAGAAGCLAAVVNHTPGPAPAGAWYEWDITALLAARNELRLHVAGLPEEVALEVRRTAWLRGVEVSRRGGGVRAVGEAVGRAPAPLDLYLVADRRPAAEARIVPSELGERFCLESAHAGSSVTVDLVGGAVVWYRAVRELPPE